MDKIKEVIAEMTLEDKIKLCSGAGFWESECMEQYGIPSFFMSDGRTACGRRRMNPTISASTKVRNPHAFRRRPRARRRGIPRFCTRWGKQSARRRSLMVWMLFWGLAFA